MRDGATSALAIASSAGGFKGVFVHGVLSALEAGGLRAAAYAAVSSSVFPTICAISGQAEEVGLRYWRSALETLQQPGNSMSEVVFHSIEESGPVFFEELFQAGRPRLLIATSAVVTEEAARETQGEGARRLGRRLLLQAARGDRTWAEEHLQAVLFDSDASTAEKRLTRENISEVIYASTRILHAWRIPAQIGGRPYIDGGYTCACPALEMAQLGYGEVIAIATEPGALYHDFFRGQVIPSAWKETPIHIIQPESDPAVWGVDFTSVTREGMEAVYAHGQQKGQEFLTARTSR